MTHRGELFQGEAKRKVQPHREAKEDRTESYQLTQQLLSCLGEGARHPRDMRGDLEVLDELAVTEQRGDAEEVLDHVDPSGEEEGETVRIWRRCGSGDGVDLEEMRIWNGEDLESVLCHHPPLNTTHKA